METKPQAGRPVAMLVHAYYEEDARVRRQAEALVRAGRPVDVFALRRDGQAEEETIDGVAVRRLSERRHQGAGIGRYLAEYASFMVRAGWRLTAAHRRRHFGLVEVHTLPDFLAFAALPVRLTGVPLLLDLHEAMPVFFTVRFPRASSRLTQGLLRLQERVSIGIAKRVITVNDALCDRLIALGTPSAKVSVILNSPAVEHFDPARYPDRPFMADGTLRLVYAGAITPIYELDVVLGAVAELGERRPELPVALDIYGRGDALDGLREMTRASGLEGRVTFHGRIPLDHVPRAIAAADIGLAPTRRDRYTEMSLSTKLFEYAAMAKPIIATHLPTIDHYFAADSIRQYESGSPTSLAEAILDVVDDPAGRERAVAETSARVERLGWDTERRRYVDLVESLAVDGRATPNGLSSSAASRIESEES